MANWGWATLKVLKRPARRGSRRLSSIKARTEPWSSRSPAARRSWTCSLNPPVLPIPSTGGALNRPICASWKALYFSRKVAAIAGAPSSGFPLRSSKGARMMNIPPALLRFVPVMVE